MNEKWHFHLSPKTHLSADDGLALREVLGDMVDVQTDLGMTLICCSIVIGGFVGLSVVGILLVDVLNWLFRLITDAREPAA